MLALFIIKPDAYHQMGVILNRVQNQNAKVIAVKTKVISLEEAKSLYISHRNQLYYPHLTRYTASATSLVCVIELEASQLRPLKESIRQQYNHPSFAFTQALTNQARLQKLDVNACLAEAKKSFLGVHCSDPGNAATEISIFFTAAELRFMSDNVNRRARIAIEKYQTIQALPSSNRSRLLRTTNPVAKAAAKVAKAAQPSLTRS